MVSIKTWLGKQRPGAKWFVLGFLAAVMLMPGAVLIANELSMAGQVFTDLRIVMDGVEMEVTWDEESGTVYLESPEREEDEDEEAEEAAAPERPGFAGLLNERLQHTYVSTRWGNGFHVVRSGNFTCHLGTRYTNGIIKSNISAVYEFGGVRAHKHIQYDLAGRYRTLTGRVIIPHQTNIVGLQRNGLSPAGSVTVIFRGGGRELGRVTGASATSPLDFTIDVRGISSLQISIVNNGRGFTSPFYTALTNLRLYR